MGAVSSPLTIQPGARIGHYTVVQALRVNTSPREIVWLLERTSGCGHFTLSVRPHEAVMHACDHAGVPVSSAPALVCSDLEQVVVVLEEAAQAAPTRRVERAPVDPGPLPPRWKRRDARASLLGETVAFVHESSTANLTLDERGMWWIGGWCDGLADLGDVEALIAWLRRGGK